MEPKPTPELTEFRALMKMTGWKPADVAREIGMSRAAISQILSGKNKPAMALERLRNRVVQLQERESSDSTATGGVVYGLQEDAGVVLRDEPAFRQLEQLRTSDPDMFQTAEQIIDSLYKQSRKSRRKKLGDIGGAK